MAWFDDIHMIIRSLFAETIGKKDQQVAGLFVKSVTIKAGGAFIVPLHWSE